MEFIKKIDKAYIAPTAAVMGKVTMGQEACAWYGTVIRGDEGPISIGDKTNIQDNSVVHTDFGFSVTIGNFITIGHGCIIHGCSIGDGSLIGMGSIILSGAKIGKNCLVGAGSLVTGKMDAPDNSLIMGSPAKVVRELTKEEIEKNYKNTETYVKLAHRHFD